MLQFPQSFNPQHRTISHRDFFKRFRGALAIGLAALLFLAPLGFRVSAQQQQSGTSSKVQQANQFTIYQDASGNVVCREATLLEREQAGNVDTESLGLRQINHLEYQKGDRATKTAPGENAGTGLTIILRATTQLQGNQAAVDAFNRAAQNWESIIQSPVTIYIDVDYGSTNFGRAWGSGVLGSTSAPSNAYPYQSVRTNLVAEASDEGNTTKQAISNALPQTTVPSDLGDKSSTVVSDSAARALGLLPAAAQSTDSAARIAFNSNFSFDFNPDDGISAGQTDFDAVATHEIGHALGFHSEAGSTARPSIWDLYRFRTGTTTSTFTTAQRILTIGGSPDALQYYFVPGNSELGLSTGGPSGATTNGGDGWQSSHWKHFSGCSSSGYIGIMDPAISSGCRRTITGNDALALGSFGYNLTNSAPPPPPPPAPTPPANDNFANAQTINGCSGSVNGVSIGATHETGEPSHDPSDTSSNSPGHTVWYQWQAPSSGSATITTEGSEFDTILAIYTGTSVNSLTRALKPDGTPAFNDDVQDGVITTSTVTFNATAGTVYKIAVDGWGGDSGALKLNWAESGCSQVKIDQAITFGALSNRTYGDAPFTVSATATSGLPVNFQILSGPATVSGNTVTITGAGTVIVRASQSGDPSFNAAPNVDQSFTVAKATPVITWNNPANIFVGTPLSSTQLNATASTPGTFSVAGTFSYVPSAGTVLNLGVNQLSVNFTPSDTTNYNSAAKTVQLTVVPLPTVTLSSATYSVGESNGNVQIIVNRVGDTSSASSVNYATNDTAGLAACNQANTGIASSRCDYATTIGTLQFAAGETTKTIFIPIVNDSYAEGNERFTLTLSNPTGATLGSTSNATITIVDDDQTTGGNPIVDPAFFVRQQYIDFLGREPDPGGLAGWQGILNNCGTTVAQPCDRIEVSAGFFRSPEFQDRGYFVFRFYPVALGRNPNYNEFMPDLAKVSGFLTDAQLETNKVAFVNEFMSRTEFQTKYGSLTDAAFRTALVQAAGIDPGIAFPQTGMTRAQFLRAFVESTAVYQKFYNQSFVVMQYFGYLRRDPDALYTNWIQTMNQNPNDYRTMINGFLNSSEYFLRFGP